MLSIGWSAWAETAAATYSNNFSDLFYNGLPKPLDWVDEATAREAGRLHRPEDRRPERHLVDGVLEPRTCARVWSLDGTAPGPGPVLTPDLIATDGRLTGDPGYGYAVIDSGLAVAGRPLRAGRDQRSSNREPLRLQELAGRRLQRRLDREQGRRGQGHRRLQPVRRAEQARDGYVTLSRKGFCGPPAPGHVEIEVGTIALGQQKDGVLGRTTQRRGWTIDSCAERTFPIATPGGPFHVKVTITPPFQPNAVDPTQFERRYFGAQLGITFEPAPS